MASLISQVPSTSRGGVELNPIGYASFQVSVSSHSPCQLRTAAPKAGVSM